MPVRGRRPRARRLITGETAPEVLPAHLQLNTTVPHKWLAVDLETGEVWRAGSEEYGEHEWRHYGRVLAPRLGAPYLVIKTGKE